MYLATREITEITSDVTHDTRYWQSPMIQAVSCHAMVSTAEHTVQRDALMAPLVTLKSKIKFFIRYAM